MEKQAAKAIEEDGEEGEAKDDGEIVTISHHKSVSR